MNGAGVGLYRVAELSLIPLVIAASVLLQQQGMDRVYLLGIGYFFSLLAVLAAIAFVFCHQNTVLGLAIILGTIALRIGRQVLPDVEMIAGLYEGALFALMCLAGHAIWQRDPLRIQRQLSLICVLGLPMMLLQVLGAGEWTQFLRTDSHSGDYDPTQYSTFLVQADKLSSLDSLQSRPAGLFSSNNALSLALSIAVGLTMWLDSRRATPLRDLLLAMTSVLAMSKTVYAVIVGVAFLVIVAGHVSQKKRVWRFLLFVSCFLFIYALLFPGLWSLNINYDLWTLNYALRAISIEQSLGIQFVDDELHEWARSARPLLFDGSGSLVNPEGGLATLLSERSWVLAIAGLVALAVVKALFRSSSFYFIVRNISVHVVIVTVCLIGLSFATSSLFALYVGSVLAVMNACHRDQCER